MQPSTWEQVYQDSATPLTPQEQAALIDQEGMTQNAMDYGLPVPPQTSPYKLARTPVTPDEDSWGNLPLGNHPAISPDLNVGSDIQGIVEYPKQVLAYLLASNALGQKVRAWYTKHGVDFNGPEGEDIVAEVRRADKQYANDPELKQLSAEQARLNQQGLALIPFFDAWQAAEAKQGGKSPGFLEQLRRGGSQALADLLAHPFSTAFLVDGAYRGVGSLVERAKVRAAGSNPFIVRPYADAAPAEDNEFKAYARLGEKARKAGSISPTGRVATKGRLGELARNAARRERYRAAKEGKSYGDKVAGHVLDTTLSGSPIPYAWMPLSPRVNASLGAQAQLLPLGYKPSGVIYQGPPLPQTRNLPPLFGLGAQAGQNLYSSQVTNPSSGKSR